MAKIRARRLLISVTGELAACNIRNDGSYYSFGLCLDLVSKDQRYSSHDASLSAIFIHSVCRQFHSFIHFRSTFLLRPCPHASTSTANHTNTVIWPIAQPRFSFTLIRRSPIVAQSCLHPNTFSSLFCTPTRPRLQPGVRQPPRSERQEFLKGASSQETGQLQDSRSTPAPLVK